MNFNIIRLVLGAYQTNCYIVFDEINRAVVIDPGYQSEDIIKTIKDKELIVDKIIITHAHPDHFGAVKELCDYFGVKSYISEMDNPMLIRRSSQAGNEISGDVLVKNGDSILLGEKEFKVMITPGHTPGGMCLLLDDVLFSGDTLFKGSIGRTDFEGGDYGQIMESLNYLMTLPENTLVLPGHGPETTIKIEKQSNPFINNIFK
ncbi:hydroxyacylglutathione hydrolase [Peptoniphilus sp. ING2-D1G]|nr:hydroxyacylglutathione hydrolase [Peptoniphilus sp. ING2-D1G]